MKIPRFPGAVGSLNLAVFHDWDPERLFVIFTVYIDESGTHAGSPVMLLGGRLAKLGQWVDFDTKWRRLLKRKSLAYFHGTEFRNRRDQFRGWDPDEGDRFVSEANKIVGKHTLYGFTVTLDHTEYKNVYRKIERHRKVKWDSKYGLCFRVALLQIPRLIYRSLPKGDHQVNFVLESGDPGSGDAKTIFDEAKRDGPPEIADLLGTLTYADKKCFPGLQAADFTAYGAFQAEQSSEMSYSAIDRDHTIKDAQRVVKYKSPVVKWPVTPALMKSLVANASADVERRQRFWQEARKKGPL